MTTMTKEQIQALLDEGAANHCGNDPARTALALHQQLADAQAAQALVVERAADGLVNAFLHMRATYAKEFAAVTPFDPLQAFYEKEVVWSAIGDAKDAIRALADPSGVTALVALRVEWDADKMQIVGLAADNDRLRREIHSLTSMLAVRLTERDALAEKLAVAEARVGALTEAAQNVVREQIYEGDKKENGISLRMLWRFTLLQEAAGLIDRSDPFFARAIAEARAGLTAALTTPAEETKG